MSQLEVPVFIDQEIPLNAAVETLCDIGENAPGNNEKLSMVDAISMENRSQVIKALVRRLAEAATATRELSSVNAELHEMVANLTRKPLHVATFKCWVDVGGHNLARVFCAGEERLVTPAINLDTSTFGTGETVFLSAERNTLLSRAPNRRSHLGQLGDVREAHDNGCVIVREHGTDVSVERAHWLCDRTITEGDRIIWCPKSRLVLDVLDSAKVPGVQQITCEPDDPPPRFAGYDEIRDAVINGFTCAFAQPDTAARYGISPAEGALLLFGPPGCGKTLLARNLAHELNARFFVINASRIYSPWVGESEQHLDDAFRRARKAAPALLFIDEIDAIGRVRGGVAQHHADRVASLLLTQMEGAGGTPGIGIIAACNRLDLLDPALRSRFGRQFMLPPPRRSALRDIVATHLHPALPYRTDSAREACIDALVHQLSSPNAGIELATVRFRDGKTREVTTRDLVSGRAVKQIVEAACETAFRREVNQGIVGIDVPDVTLATEATIAGWRNVLCVGNVRNYLSDLPDDVDVVAVDPVTDLAQPARYLGTIP